MRINRIGTVFGSSWNPYTNKVGRVNRVNGNPEEQEEKGKQKKQAQTSSQRDEYIPSDQDGRVIQKNNNYNDQGYLMRQAENSARFDNFNTDEL
jgi:hypothetical protein